MKDLRERILRYLDMVEINHARDWSYPGVLHALRGEVERHGEVHIGSIMGKPVSGCVGRDGWPCPTLQRIAKGIGVEE